MFIDLIRYDWQLVSLAKINYLLHVLLGEDASTWIGWIIEYNGCCVLIYAIGKVLQVHSPSGLGLQTSGTIS